RGDPSRPHRVRFHPRLAALLPLGLRKRDGAPPRFSLSTAEGGLTGFAADVCVIGGGPAGSSAASRLARLGYRVCIVERGSAVGDAVVESVAPSIVPVLETLGVLGEIEHAGFARCERVRLLWSGEEEPFRQRRSAVLVDRARFDRILLDAALRS